MNTIEIEAGRTISFRPSSYDVNALKQIHADNNHLTDAAGLIREALKAYILVRPVLLVGPEGFREFLRTQHDALNESLVALAAKGSTIE